MQSMDTNETMDQMIEALQDQVRTLQNAQYVAEQRASASEIELTKAQDRVNELSLQRTKLTMLSTNQTELITDLQGQLDSMYAAYSMQEEEIRSIQDDYRTAQTRLEHSDMMLIQINERIQEEAKKQRDSGDHAAAEALERLDIGALSSASNTPRTSVEVSRSTHDPTRDSMAYRSHSAGAAYGGSGPRVVARPNEVFEANGRPRQPDSPVRVQARVVGRPARATATAYARGY